MPVNKSYDVDKTEHEAEDGNAGVWTTASRSREEKVYSFDEAIDMTGIGLYNISLLTTLSLATLAMGLDIFGFSVVVSGATCDFDLNLEQTSTMLSAAFVGPIVMAYPWGYISDTQGRKKCLLISLWTSFLVSTISAFSTNWVILAVLKFISTSFSSCAQSVTYTLLGESCPQRVRDMYMLIMTSLLNFSLAVYIGSAYGTLNLDFAYDLGLVTFTPWRLLAILLSSTLGISAFLVFFFYESPKFLLNAGHNEEVLDVLRGIYKRNGGKLKYYPVNKVYLNEEGNINLKNVPLLQSLWNQITPLFKPPLLWRSLQLYFLAIVIYGTNNSYFMWLPLLAKNFILGLNSADKNQETGLCNVIVSSYNNNTQTGTCHSTMEISLFWTGLAVGLFFIVVLLCIAKIAYKKRTLIIIILMLCGICGILAVVINNNIVSFIMFLGQLSNELAIGMMYSFFVDLYPTSYRGMASCLCTMIARASATGGVSLLGAFVMTHCATTFYVSSCLMFAGVLVTMLLPRDGKRKG